MNKLKMQKKLKFFKKNEPNSKKSYLTNVGFVLFEGENKDLDKLRRLI